MSTPETLTLKGKLQPEQTKSYVTLPFEVPGNVEQIDVSYRYSDAIGSDPRLTGGNTIDIGIFDVRGKQFGGEGFRGWSGSARDQFYIALDNATPGYMPGAISQGTWFICLGVYKVADEGCDYEVTITFTYGEIVQPIHFPRRLELSAITLSNKANESGWYRGELHCHTHHSDGDSSVQDVVRKAESLGLEFLAITDHNVLTQQIKMRDIHTSLMLIPGMEVTTYHGHWNIWGAGGWIDFRALSEDDMQQSIETALQAGYLISCNHPRPYGPEWEFPDVTGFHCIEVWNGPWQFFNADAISYWENKLRNGEHYVAVGGSDSHFHTREHPAQLGHPTTCIYCEDDPSPQALVDSLRAGHAYITESPQGASLLLSSGNAMMGDTLHTNDAQIEFTIQSEGASGKRVQLCGVDGVLQQWEVVDAQWQASIAVNVRQTNYIRAQLVTGEDDQLQVHTLTNPIYIYHNT